MLNRQYIHMFTTPYNLLLKVSHSLVVPQFVMWEHAGQLVSTTSLNVGCSFQTLCTLFMY